MKLATLVLAAVAATTPAAHKHVPNIPPTTRLPHVLYSMRYIDLKPGTGALAQPHQFYTVNYTGWLKDGTKFDSSYDHTPAGPITFQQGVHRVIPGWDTAFDGMHVGGKRRLLVPYQLAYGEQGRPPVIPAKAELIFDVELVSASDIPPPPPAPVPVPQPSQPVAPPSAPPAPAAPPAAAAKPLHPEGQ